MKSPIKVLLLSCLVLSGCARLNEEFDCPAPKGGSCKRMDQVYDLVNGKEALAKTQGPAGVMPLWVAPYEDTAGNYHQATRIYSAQ